MKNSDNSLSSLEDFQSFIDSDFRIVKSTDLLKLYPSVYYKAQKLKYLSYLNFKNDLIRRRPGQLINKFKSIEDVQNFVNDNNISSLEEFKRFDDGVYRNYIKLRKKENKDIIFSKYYLNFEEKEFLKYLLKYNIKFIPQYSIYGEIKNQREFKYDFYLIDYNTLIEIQGCTHLFSIEENINAGFGDENVIFNDKNKQQSAINNGFNLFYFTFEKELYYKKGYFAKIYTNIEELLKLITGKEVLDIDNEWEMKYKNYIIDGVERSIEIIQTFINKNKISTREELRNLDSSLYYLMKKYKLNKILKFYDSNKTTKNIVENLNTLEEFNEFILMNSLDYTSLIENFKYIYLKIKKYNLEYDVKYKLFDNYYKSLNEITIEDINKYIQINKITKLEKLYQFNRSIYNIILKQNLKSNIVFYTLTKEEKEIDYVTKRFRNANRYLKKNKIKSIEDLKNFNILIYNILKTKSWVNKLTFYN